MQGYVVLHVYFKFAALFTLLHLCSRLPVGVNLCSQISTNLNRKLQFSSGQVTMQFNIGNLNVSIVAV